MLLAIIAFVLALFKVHIGTINLEILGLMFMAVHFLIGGWSPWAGRIRT